MTGNNKGKSKLSDIILRQTLVDEWVRLGGIMEDCHSLIVAGWKAQKIDGTCIERRSKIQEIFTKNKWNTSLLRNDDKALEELIEKESKR